MTINKNKKDWILPLLSMIIVFSLLFLYWTDQGKIISQLNLKVQQFEKNTKSIPNNEKFLSQKLALEKNIIDIEKEIITITNNKYMTTVQSIGALSIILTAFLSWRNSKIAEDNLKVTEEKIVTERFSKAIELLADERLSARLGGIYALERIALDSEKDYWQVIEVLASFVREKTLIKSNQKEYNTDDDFAHEEDFGPPAETDDDLAKYHGFYANKDYRHYINLDIQAVLTIFGRLPKPVSKKHMRIIDLRSTDLRGAELSGDFSGINFENANLKYAIIIGKADFRNAKGLQCVQVKDIKNFGEGFYSPVLNKELHLTQ